MSSSPPPEHASAPAVDVDAPAQTTPVPAPTASTPRPSSPPNPQPDPKFEPDPAADPAAPPSEANRADAAGPSSSTAATATAAVANGDGGGGGGQGGEGGEGGPATSTAASPAVADQGEAEARDAAALIGTQLASTQKSRIVLPSWVWHPISATGQSTQAADDIEGRKKNGTIFSVAAHPDGSRVATAGIDTRIKMWNTDAILDPTWETRREAILAEESHVEARKEQAKNVQRKRRQQKIVAHQKAHQDAQDAQAHYDSTTTTTTTDPSTTPSHDPDAPAANTAPALASLPPPAPSSSSHLPIPPLDPEDDTDDDEPQEPVELDRERNKHYLLSSLQRHTGSVLVVRWSESGRYLASGSDDSIVLIWELDPIPAVAPPQGADRSKTYVNPSEEGRFETWRPVQRLSGHTSDVSDLAWGPQDTFLATSGFDSTVVLYNGHTFERLKRIEVGGGFIKGICFDPVGQYLAAFSDDKAVRVWSILTIPAPAHDEASSSQKNTMKVGHVRHIVEARLVTKIREPFARSPAAVFFNRPAWSPDGQYLVVPNATSATVSKGVGRGKSASKSGGRVFTAQIIERGSWSTQQSYVGHEHSTMVCAYSPRIFKPLQPDQPAATLSAVGSMDQSVSVWITGLARPVFVAKDVFDRQVMDMSWSVGSKDGSTSRDGMILYACSADGNLAVFILDPDEVTTPLPDKDLKRTINRWGFRSYDLGTGSSPATTLTSSLHSTTAIGTLEQPNQLKPRKKGDKAKVAKVNAAGPAASDPTTATAASNRPSTGLAALHEAPTTTTTITPTFAQPDPVKGSMEHDQARVLGTKRPAQASTDDVLRAQKRIALAGPSGLPQVNGAGRQDSITRALQTAQTQHAVAPPPPPPQPPTSRPLLPPHGRRNVTRHNTRPQDRWPGNFDTQNAVLDDELLTANYADTYDSTTDLRWRLVGFNQDADPDPEAPGEEAAAGLSSLSLQRFERHQDQMVDAVGPQWLLPDTVWTEYLPQRKSIVACTISPPLVGVGGSHGIAAVATLDGTLSVYTFTPMQRPHVAVQRLHMFRTIAVTSILRLRVRTMPGLSHSTPALLSLDNDGNVCLWPNACSDSPLLDGFVTSCRSLVGDPQDVSLFTLTANGVVLLMRRETGETYWLSSPVPKEKEMGRARGEPVWEQLIDPWFYRWSDAWEKPESNGSTTEQPSVNGSTATSRLSTSAVPSGPRESSMMLNDDAARFEGEAEDDADDEVVHGLLSHPVAYLEQRATPYLAHWTAKTSLRAGHQVSAAARAARARRRDGEGSVSHVDPAADVRKQTVRRAATRSHWEARRSAALAFGSSAEYVNATLGLARTLCLYTTQGEAFERESAAAACLAMMDSLMGPFYHNPYDTDHQPSWNPYVLNVRKRHLLASVLQVLLECPDEPVANKARSYREILTFVPCN